MSNANLAPMTAARRALAAVITAAGLVVAPALGAAPAGAVYPVTGTTTSATAEEAASCAADQAARTRDPHAPVYWFKRGQVWFVSDGTSGPAAFCFVFGDPGDIGVVGTWGIPGVTWPTPGVFRPSTGQWFLSGSEFGSSAAQVRVLGGPGDVPVVGDWNQDGATDIGVVRGQTWYLQTDPTSTVAQGTRTIGQPGDIPVSGDLKDGFTASTGGMALFVYRPSIASFVVISDSGYTSVYGTAGIGDVPVAPAYIQSQTGTYAPAGTAVYRPSTGTLFKGLWQKHPPGVVAYQAAQIGQRGDQVLRAGVACPLGPFTACTTYH